MKKTRLILALAMTTLLMVTESTAVFADETVYKYPIAVDSEDWFLYSVLEKSEMLKIDDQVISEMSDEELVRCVADYPYLVDIYVCDTMNEGLLCFVDTCDAFRELMNRDTGSEAFLKYSKKIIKEMEANPRTDGRTEFVTIALEDIAEELDGTRDENMNAYAALATPRTPNGNAVSYLSPSESHSSSVHATRDNEVVNTYGVTLVRNGSCKYNCHSYAWHSTSSSNSYWIDNPSIYMTDGSYTRVYSGSVSNPIYYYGLSVNDKIYYASNTHSALFIDSPTNGAALATLKAKSKWGQLGVFKHSVTNVPASYNYSNVTIWHR